MHVLAESQQMRVRRPLARTIAEILAGQPDRVLPWLSDGRWYVVRNVVHILGWIGGNGIADRLRTTAEHPEPRVRREVVAALSQSDHDAARPILMRMLKSAEPELFGAILHQIAMDGGPAVAGTLLELLREPGFRGRSEAERRALFLALATRGEPILPALESELNAGGLFSRRSEPDHRGIALCIARIGTPAARAILERGLRSKRAAIRKASVIAGASGDAGDD
jgi:HEAT repeat protein